MPERYVYCGGLRPARTRPDALYIDVHAPVGSPDRVNLHIGDLAGPLADNIPDVLTDLLEIAAYVYCADQFTTRGTSQMTHMGAEWRRQFRFRIPVRRPDVWNREDVCSALIETLSFLSEDEFTFEFKQAAESASFPSYLGYSDASAQTISPDEVILLSGGLDSLAGAVDGLIGDRKRVILVSHQGSTKIASKQNALVAALRERTRPKSLFYVPVTINKGQEEAVEFTQRTRSLMFATLGLIVARMFGRSDLSFYENGVVSFNLPIAEHVVGARASRTTHPRVLSNCSQLFSTVLSEAIGVNNSYVWKTKSEVVRILAERGCADLIDGTLSCSRVREATRTSRHCGVCSQCVDRRFGILAAGLGEKEPADNYAVDLFTGAHRPGPDLTMMESYVVRAQKLATMSDQAFAATYGQIFRAIPYLPGTADENVRRIWDLHRRHGREVIEVVDHELRINASVAKTFTLPANSLLAMIVSPVAKQPDYADPIEAEPTAVEQAAADPHDFAIESLAFAIDHSTRKILFQGGIEFSGSVYGLIATLAQSFEEDLDAGTFKEQYRFVKARTLARRLDIDEQSLRQRVSRTRRNLEQTFLTVRNLQLDADDVIQNEGWKGYRLNPYMLLVKPAQLRDQPQTSQPSSPNVTDSPSTD
jgi:hypothetical protein